MNAKHCFIVAVASLSLLAANADVRAAEPKVDFVRDIQPLLAKHCYECHGAKVSEAGLRLDLKARALKGGDSGAAIKPNASGESLLIERVESDDKDLRMPQGKKPPLSADEIKKLSQWIDQGAEWPADADVAAKGDLPHWSLAPLARPALPIPKNLAWSRSAVDRFISATLDEKQLHSAPEADRRTLIRRLSFDLIGLPPGPEEVNAYLADQSPDAYERLADRLLASPRLGERWARHWMDVVHFAETHGNDQDRPRPNAWPYRDYLIQAFNGDTPYRRFMAEQVAGDVLFPDDPRGIVATGMISAGPWDESSQRDIVDDTIDKKNAQLLDRDDMVSTVMSTFTSTTIHCARCHSHKFDPIPQSDYYALQAVFAGIDRANRPYDDSPRTFARRRELLAAKKQLETAPPAELLTDAVRKQVAAWEESTTAQVGRWIVLTPTSAASQGGATVSIQADGSMLFGGKRPERDTYTITARTPLHGITAVRLEVLSDDSLPQRGPGRQDNGNLHLSEFSITAAPAANPTAKSGVAISTATADFDQQGWDIRKTLDGLITSAWGIFPAVGQTHVAIFELKTPIAVDASAGDTELTFTLDQLHGGGHLIGRPRLSVTTSPLPIKATPLPAGISAVLGKAETERTDADRVALAKHVLAGVIESQLAALPPPKMVYAAANDFTPESSFKPTPKPRPVFVLRRGDIKQPGAAAEPGALSCVSAINAKFTLPNPDDEGARRAALAKWLADDRNVLVWRSIANRMWHYHFGRGIVDTPNDLGRMGAPPTHPELLDWLAIEFRDGNGASSADADSLKRLHRLLVTSAVYRQASTHDEACAKADSGNRYLWRMNRQRLDAESVRDAVLVASGKIDYAMGGPSVKQFIESPGIHVTPIVDYLKFDVDDPGNFRRSVYRFLFRTLPDPFMESMDCPDPSQLAPTRNTSVTALQALAMLNNRFTVRQSEHFAARLAKMSSDPETQIDAAFQLTFCRPARPDEATALSAYAAKHGLANACRLILNSNEFMFVP